MRDIYVSEAELLEGSGREGHTAAVPGAVPICGTSHEVRSEWEIGLGYRDVVHVRNIVCCPK